MAIIKQNPDADAGQFKSLANDTAALPSFGDKNTVAAMLHLSKRSVDNLMRRGCPHLAIGKRRVRFDLAEVAAWLKQQYGQQHRGPVHTNTAQ